MIPEILLPPALPVVHWDWLRSGDTAALAAIDAAGYPAPWPEAEFHAMLRPHPCVVVCAVARSEPGDALGYVVYEIATDRLLVLRLAVAPGCRRQGIGRYLLGRLACRCSPLRRVLEIAVSEGELGVQLFLRASGLRCVRVDRRAWYAAEGSGWEDTYVFQTEGKSC